MTRHLRYLRPAVVFLLMLFTFAMVDETSAQGRIGLGAQLGDPTGVNLKIYNPGAVSYDFLGFWDLDDHADSFGLMAHGIWERPFPNAPGLRFTYGPGLWFETIDTGADDKVWFGISGSFGLGYMIDRFEIFGQLTPMVAVVPETDGDLGGGLGVRFFF